VEHIKFWYSTHLTINLQYLSEVFLPSATPTDTSSQWTLLH